MESQKDTFNSLFGIHQPDVGPVGELCVAFNSLFGILEKKMLEADQKKAPFNSLFGIHNSGRDS